MSIEKDISSRILMGRSSLQLGNEEPRFIDEYQLAPDLPDSDKKRQVCIDHFRQGAASELVGDFDLGGVQFPEKDMSQEITTQLSCKGASCVLKKCGLTIAQYDADGAKLGEMRLT